MASITATRTGSRLASRMATRARERLVEDLERLCSDAGISAEALARAAGIPPSYVRRILAGQARPSHETYAKLAVVLGADLATRLYPNTGPTIRDRHQARMLEHLLGVADPRWRPFTEVGVSRPARGWIDVVLHEVRAAVVVATEIESDLRRIEQTVRWSKEKAESLPSWSGWHALGEGRSISQLLVVRRTRSNRTIADEFARQLAVAYPAHPEDALASLTGSASWPGPALVWAVVKPTGVRLVPSR